MRGVYAIFSRELLLLMRKIGHMGYIVSSIISPFIYLLAFGFGLGRRVDVDGGYLPFLAGGIIAVTVMINSFQQTASSISAGRTYYHIFQNVVLAPVNDCSIILGIVLCGMLRGVFFGTLIYIMAWLVFGAASFSSTILIGAILGSFCFASLGAIVGLYVRQPDDVSFINNIIIMPMTFFGGTFFPVDSLPAALRMIVTIFPIGALNRMIRASAWNENITSAAILLLGLGTLFFVVCVWKLKKYSE